MAFCILLLHRSKRVISLYSLGLDSLPTVIIILLTECVSLITWQKPVSSFFFLDFPKSQDPTNFII